MNIAKTVKTKEKEKGLPIKKHNGIISFWKFMFCMMIVVFHLTEKNGGIGIFSAGRIGVEFFFIVSGYFMTKKALSKEDNCTNIGKETFQYIWKKAISFFDYMLIAFIISFFVKNWVSTFKKNEIVNSVWNLCFLEMSGIKSTAVVGQTWYISAMLISMLILYPLIRRYRKNFTYLIAPLIVIFIGGWISHKYGNITGRTVWTGLIYKGLLRAIFELAIGSILYEFSNKIKTINFNKVGKIFLNIIELVGFSSIFIIINIKDASNKYDFIMILIISISLAIAFSEKTILYNLSNNKFCYYLEKLSLPIYLNHIWIILIINKTLPQLSYWRKLIILLIFTIIISIIIQQFITLIRKVNLRNVLKKVFICEK